MTNDIKENAIGNIAACPFCGPGTAMQVYQHGPDELDCFVQCDACTTCGPTAKSKELAVIAWNSRATSLKDIEHCVDWLGLALDLEAQAKHVESQTVERAMTAAACGLRMMGTDRARS
jgi:hypothetical protein